MALHPDFPRDPYEILDPSIRWFPAAESLREQGYDKLLPPLVAELRIKVAEWRNSGYAGASDTSVSLLYWWFKEEHILRDAQGAASEFRYYFAQREAIETVVWLYEVAKVKDKYDLLRYNSTGVLSPQMFTEEWLRFVIKMATGAGKTKVMSLLIAWAYYHKLYEKGSGLAKNFLVIAPNVIVFERIKKDFEGLSIFFDDPVLPPNGYDGQNWEDDFQPTLHLQDDIRFVSSTGNIFLTNIHRVFDGAIEAPSFEDEDTSEYFLGSRPVTNTNDSSVDLGDIVRDIDELVVINDEAHHIHEENAWLKSIRDIDNRLKQKGGKLSLQLDVTATPKKSDGSIFVQTISDYPLVEAIYQRVVKTPVVPDEVSRSRLKPNQSAVFTEKFKDYIHLGVEEWRKSYEMLAPMKKKSILFIMADDTKNCDEIAEYLRGTFADLKDSVLTIHTNKSGEISETSSSKNKEQLEELRKQANDIDSLESKYKVIVSVMMLKEGWDVKNVTTIVGLRPYASDSKVLPEQTLGRGLRRMFFGGMGIEEFVSVIGTPAFLDFVESITGEGVILEKRPMGSGSKPISPLVVEVDLDNPAKDIEKLDIEIPVTSPRIQREYKNLASLDVSSFGNKRLPVLEFSEQERKEIVFKDVVLETVHHATMLDTDIEPSHQSVIGFFVQAIMREMRLFGCYDILYGKVRSLVQDYLFETPVQLDDSNVLKNLSEAEYTRTIKESFKKAINELTIADTGDTEIKNYIKVSQSRPFVVNDKAFLVPARSVFTKIVGDSDFELEFAAFLEGCPDIISYSKNFQNKEANALRIEYKNLEGFIAAYVPDFFVKTKDGVFIVETKGREETDDRLKFERLVQWCEDVNARQSRALYSALYIRQDVWNKYPVRTFDELVRIYKP